MQNQNTGWLKLSAFSFMGIIIAVLILSFTAPNGMYGNTMTGMMNGNSMNGNAMYGMNMNGNAGTMMSTPMGNMQTQMGMNGMGSMMSNPMTMQTGTSSSELYNIKQTLIQMQYQINQIQQNQMMMMNSGGMQTQSAMPQSGMSGMSGMSNMNGMGMMGMMPMDSMSSMGMMPMSSMNNMSSGGSTSGGSSGGSMSGGSSGGMSMM